MKTLNSSITGKGGLTIDSIFTETYYKLVNLSKEYVLSLLIDIIKKSGMYPLLKSEFVSVEDIVGKLQFIPKSVKPISWMLSYLKESDLLELRKSGEISYFKIIKDLPVIDSRRIINRMLDLDRSVRPSNLLLEKAAKEYPDFFQGSKTAVDILFTEDRMKLWTKYFSNNNSGYVVYNALATSGLLKWLPDTDNLQILEIGGGTGSAAVFFLREMHRREQLSRIKEYIFSDISPILVRAGNNLIMKELPDDRMITLKTLDFNSSFSSQGIKENSLDAVFGVNSIHAAENIIRSLQYIYEVLKPGGVIVLSECVRSKRDSLLFQELIFNLLDNYTDAELSDVRPMSGFLDIESWKKIFDKNNLKNVEVITNMGLWSERTNAGGEMFAMIIKGEK
jgi:SAM-dependent methyltransferase